MSAESISLTQTQQSLELTRAQQQALMRRLRLLPYAVAALVIVAGLRTAPRAGFVQARPALYLALACLAVTLVVVIGRRDLSRVPMIAVFVALILSSAMVVYLQPDTFGVLGMYVAVTVAAMRIHGRTGGALALLALLALALSETLATRTHSLSLAGNEIGLIAFYILGVLGHRLAEGQDLALRLMEELEANRDAQAQAAALAERTRLAREMHDVLAHSLSGLALQLAATRLLVAQRGADAEIVTAVDRAHHLARAGLEEARRAIGMLREDALPGPDRLEALTHDFEQDTGVPCSLDIDGDERALSSEARLTLYRVAQEALTNIRRHAEAERVEVRLSYEPDGACLSVEDFGRAPEPASAPGGYGLTGMRERAELIGGRLTTGPTSTGFRVELWVPA